MGNNKAEAGTRDRKHVAKGESDSEVRSLMKKTGTTYSQILALIHRYGHDQASIERAALRLRST